MNKLILVASVVSIAACTHQKPAVSVSAPLPTVGKAVAPVSVDADVHEDHVHLTLRFENEGDRVSVDVTGIEGLHVKSPPSLVAGGHVRAKETRTYDFDLERKSGRNELMVSVRGTFAGAPLARVVTFTLGDGPLEQSGVKVVTQDGDTIKLMPSSP